MGRLSFRAFRAALCLVLFGGNIADAHASSAPTAFHSIPLPVSGTPFGAQWQRVKSSRTAAPPGARGLQGEERLRFVNTWANHSVAYKEDRENWGSDDYWAMPTQTLQKQEGDCEDIAILKMQALKALGVPASNMFLVIGTDLVARRGHALLLVQSDDGIWVLDSSIDGIHHPDDYGDFRPIFSLGDHGSWLHGYDANTQSPVRYADTRSPRASIAPASMGTNLSATLAAQTGARVNGP